jgi:hypothetical protein
VLSRRLTVLTPWGPTIGFESDAAIRQILNVLLFNPERRIANIKMANGGEFDGLRAAIKSYAADVAPTISMSIAIGP